MRWIGTRIKSVGVVVALVGALAVGVAVGGATLGIAGAADSPGGSGPKLPSAADRAKLRQQLDAFRACMKAHGVDLPEPPAPGQGGEGFRRGLPPGVDRDKLRAAHDACKDKLPAPPQLSAADRAKLRQQLDAFRVCMKAHGVDLPEPPAPGQGGEGFRRGLPPGVDRDKLRAAHDACKDKLPPHPGGPIGPIGGPIGGRAPGSGPGSGGATDPQGAGTPV